ncbi:hypothetical protein BH10BAC2_BH10BAC2_02510 [soil metagenome]
MQTDPAKIHILLIKKATVLTMPNNRTKHMNTKRNLLLLSIVYGVFLTALFCLVF